MTSSLAAGDATRRHLHGSASSPPSWTIRGSTIRKEGNPMHLPLERTRFNKRVLASMLAAVIPLGAVGLGGRGRRVRPDWRSGRIRAYLGSAAARPPDGRKRLPGRSQQGERASPLVQGRRARQDRLVRAARRLRRRSGPRPWHQLRPEARQHRRRLPRVRPDRHPRRSDTPAEPIRPGHRPLPGCPRLQSDPDRSAGTGRLPPGPVPARGRRRAWLQPLHPDRRLTNRLQRPDRRHG